MNDVMPCTKIYGPTSMGFEAQQNVNRIWMLRQIVDSPKRMCLHKFYFGDVTAYGYSNNL